MLLKRLSKLIAIIVCITLCASVFLVPVNTEAASVSELKEQLKAAENRVNQAKADRASQQEIKNALDEQIAVQQALINECNTKINGFNAQIAEKQREIDEKNAKIESDKKQFKKRIRAIYMSNTQSSIQVLLGADSFSDYLTLAQMTKSVTAHDKALINSIVEVVSSIEKEQKEIQVLLDEQAAIKAEIAKHKSSLDVQVAEINDIIAELDHDIEADRQTMKDLSDKIDRETAPPPPSSGNRPGYDGQFLWPSPYYFYVIAGFDSDDSVHNGNHKGIDIAGGGISGTPIIAAASGTVYSTNNSCGHNYGKYYSCGCGGGYGNYVAIDHGQSGGNYYKTLYAHMTRTTVSWGQYVEKGQVIGYVGTTGWSTGPHIHFEIIVNGVKRNPMLYF